MDMISNLKSRIKESNDIAQKIILKIELAHATRFTDPDFSIDTSMEAWQMAEENSEQNLELKCLISICTFYYSRGYFDDLSKWAKLLSTKAEKYQQKVASGRANLFFYAGSVQQKKYQEAEEYLYKALNNFENVDNEQGQTACYVSLGNLKFNQGDYENAYKNYQTALQLCPDDAREIQSTLKQNIASVFVMQKKYLQAWEVYQNLLDIIPEQEYLTRAMVFVNLGTISLETEELEAAAEYFDEVINLTRNIKHHNLSIKAYFKKAEIFLLQNNPVEAEKIIQSFDEFSSLKIYQERYLEFYEKMIEFCDKQNDLIKLKKYQQKMDILKSQL